MNTLPFGVACHLYNEEVQQSHFKSSLIQQKLWLSGRGSGEGTVLPGGIRCGYRLPSIETPPLNLEAAMYVV